MPPGLRHCLLSLQLSFSPEVARGGKCDQCNRCALMPPYPEEFMFSMLPHNSIQLPGANRNTYSMEEYVIRAFYSSLHWYLVMGSGLSHVGKESALSPP